MRGKLETYFETGSEGVYWTFFEDGEYTSPWDKTHFLQNGVYLKIFAEDGSLAWEGEIVEDRISAFKEFRHPGASPGMGQPVSCGYNVHWTQDGVDPNEWGKYFFSETYRAELDISNRKEQGGRGPYQLLVSPAMPPLDTLQST